MMADLHLQSPSKKLRSCAERPPAPLTGGGGGVAFAFAFMSGKLMFFPAPLSMSNVSGEGSGTICGAGGAFTGDAILKPLGGGSRGTGVEDFDGTDLFMIAVGRGGGDTKVLRVGADIPIWRRGGEECGWGTRGRPGLRGGVKQIWSRKRRKRVFARGDRLWR